jgi:hypothetical protein
MEELTGIELYQDQMMPVETSSRRVPEQMGIEELSSL